MASSNYTDPQAEQLQTQSNQIDPSYVAIRSPEMKRRNASPVWDYMEKRDGRIYCKVEGCTAEGWSISCSNSTLATHLANAHDKQMKTRGFIIYIIYIIHLIISTPNLF